MMETKTAVENMESILDVEGINGVYIGPSDLGFSYGLVPKLDREEPEILKIYEKIVKECGKRGLYPGIHCSGADGAGRAINMAPGSGKTPMKPPKRPLFCSCANTAPAS